MRNPAAPLSEAAKAPDSPLNDLEFRNLREHELQQLGDEEEWGHEPAEEFSDSIDARRALQQAYDELGDDHRRVVELHVLGPCSAVEAASQIDGMTDANVHQIASRFQRRFKQLFGGGDTSG